MNSIKLFFQKYKRVIFWGQIYWLVLAFLAVGQIGLRQVASWQEITHKLTAERNDFQTQLGISQSAVASQAAIINSLMTEDQRIKNQELEAEINQIQNTFKQASQVYEDLLDLLAVQAKPGKLDDTFAESLKVLSTRNYTNAREMLTTLKQSIKTEQDKVAASFKIPENVPVSNTAPGSGYSRQQVETDIGTFMVSIVAADLNSTRVIVDTASDGTCANDCPVMPLADYVSRSGAFAGINGPYFCPASYPSCADKKNSFDTLLMNKNKVYFNSDNNVYSNVPAVIFQGGSARFVGRSLEWGRDTSPDSVIAAQPMLVQNGQVSFGGDGDPKKGSRGVRGFIGTTNSIVYIGFIHNTTVAEAARVLQKMGIQNALNLDSGGSSALWYGGYKIAPGRALPFGILLVRK